MDVADIDDGRRPGLTTDEKAELVILRRKTRVLELENEILKRAAAYFARRTSSQMSYPSWSTGVPTCRSTSARGRGTNPRLRHHHRRPRLHHGLRLRNQQVSRTGDRTGLASAAPTGALRPSLGTSPSAPHQRPPPLIACRPSRTASPRESAAGVHPARGSSTDLAEVVRCRAGLRRA